MRLILRTHCTNDFFDGCSYALLDLTPALAGVILQRKAAFDVFRANDPDLTAIRCYNCEAVYFSALPEGQSNLFDQVEEDIAGKTFIQAPAGFEIGEEVIEHTECDQMWFLVTASGLSVIRSTAMRW
jgi:hypothetical protein